MCLRDAGHSQEHSESIAGARYLGHNDHILKLVLSIVSIRNSGPGAMQCNDQDFVVFTHMTQG